MTLKPNENLNHQADDSRRGFIRGSSILLAGAIPLGTAAPAAATQQAPRRVGLIGCGRRGGQLAAQLLTTDPHARLVAMADIFGDKLHQSWRSLNGRFDKQIDVDASRKFVGLDSTVQMLDRATVDTVILAGYPVFRPDQVSLAISAGKQVISARPVAIDGTGIRVFSSALAMAKEAGISVRVSNSFSSPIVRSTMAQLCDGRIGKIRSIQTLSRSRLLPSARRTRGKTELEQQLRNWQGHAWLSGGGMLEEQVDQLQVCNELMQAVPDSVQSIATTSHVSGDDGTEQASLEYLYPNGVTLSSKWRRSKRQWSGPLLTVECELGWADLCGGRIYDYDLRLLWRHTPEEIIQGHISGDRMNGDELSNYGALNASLAAIAGRQAAISNSRVRLEDILTSQRKGVELSKINCLTSSPPTLV